jgi:hypothetical protein
MHDCPFLNSGPCPCPLVAQAISFPSRLVGVKLLGTLELRWRRLSPERSLRPPPARGVDQMGATLIRNGRIVTAVDDYKADILTSDGRIHTIGMDLSVGPDVAVHDAAGLLVLPGGVDVHTHLDWEFGASRTVDTFATGTKAAAFGGTTTVIDFCNQNRGESPLVGLEDWHRRRANACVDVGAHMILSQQIVEAFPWDGAASLFGARQ